MLGYDLFAAEGTTIEAGGKGIVKTNIAMRMPNGVYGRIAPRFTCFSALTHIEPPSRYFLDIPSYQSVINICIICFVFDRTRSGLACKNHIDCGAGVIDADYRGDIGVILFNHGKERLEVKLHDRVAQLILERHMVGEVVKEVDDLDATERGASGYGSTGFGGEMKK